MLLVRKQIFYQDAAYKNILSIFTVNIKSTDLKPAARKRVIVSVTNDLVSDNRVHKVCSTLHNMGFSVTLAGRQLPHSLEPEKRVYHTRRFRLPFNKGPFFYGCYNFRLLVYLLFNRFDVLLSNDLDTLPANFLAARIKSKPLVYDSHEYFTEVPELLHRPLVKKIWGQLEKWMVPDADAAYTVCDSIARIYTGKYNIPFKVIRNLPLSAAHNDEDDPGDKENIILYQGAVNAGRGLDKAIRAVSLLENVKLVIAGDGDKKTELENLVKEEGLSEKVEFKGKLPIEQLTKLTPKALIGLSIEEDIGLNYHFALPNKLFDYIQAHVPVLVSNLPEMAAVVSQYGIGEVISDSEPQNLARVIKEMLENKVKRRIWKENLKKASHELVWEREEPALQQIFSPFL